MSAKDFLKGIRFLDVEIKSIQERVKILEADAECLQSMRLSDMPKGGKVRSAEDIIADVIDLQSKYLDKLNSLNDKKKEVEYVIEHIERPEYRTVLRMRYLDCKTWNDIAEAMDYSRRSVIRFHGQALLEFESAYESWHTLAHTSVVTCKLK